MSENTPPPVDLGSSFMQFLQSTPLPVLSPIKSPPRKNAESSQSTVAVLSPTPKKPWKAAKNKRENYRIDHDNTIARVSKAVMTL